MMMHDVKMKEITIDETIRKEAEFKNFGYTNPDYFMKYKGEIYERVEQDKYRLLDSFEKANGNYGGINMNRGIL